ncbi:hypothetical protein [Methylobacterium sp. WL12]|nr:hypothetical protein [Methylobacterium sp. WL12]
MSVNVWVLSLGLALLAQDLSDLKVPLKKSARWIEATRADLVAWWRRQKR